mmetsp:Transcript_6849/g.12090  ORF Transcript_6849/g.12090 Transcript_6849/m.12090 type:complete len:384 (+) Transcript_6849:355-1506(+)
MSRNRQPDLLWPEETQRPNNPDENAKLCVNANTSVITPENSPEDRAMPIKQTARRETAATRPPQQPRRLTLADFGVGRQLGKGKFGFVHLAKEKQSGKHVALKIMWKSDLEKENLVHQIRREIEIHSRIRHKNIVRLYSYFMDAQRVYLVLEYVPGGDVLSLMRSYDACRLPEKRASEIMRELVSAVSVCHKIGVVHRDIKPENILVANNGSVRLADFGWACAQDNPRALERMKRITFCGTLDYIAPEMNDAADKNGYDERVDIWMAACVCYEMLQGTAPFYHEDVAKTQEKILNVEYTLPADVSESARDLVGKMLQKDPEKRLNPIKKVLFHPWIVKHAPKVENKKLLNQVASKGAAASRSAPVAPGKRAVARKPVVSLTPK